jgi:probable F420-dependent oxidoreductase
MERALSGTGVWSGELRYGDNAGAADAAGELESLGYSALWIPDVGGDVFTSLENLLAGTKTVTVATGILNLWMHDAKETAAEHVRLTAAHGDRLMFGIGCSHQVLIDMKEPGTYQKPLAETKHYLDELDSADAPLAPENRMLAALGPKMIELARTRTAGTHPYLVTADHVALSREALGPAALLAPEMGVVLSTDPETARRIARKALEFYLGLPNYTNNWMRLGFDESDIAGGGSDRLIDAMVAWGDEAAIAARVQEFRDAGANHVCIQVMSEDSDEFPLPVWRQLAPALIG